MLPLSNIAKLEKNRLITDTVYLVLLEITVTPNIVLRLCSNTENIEWNGETWVAFPFDMEAPLTTSKGELPRFTVRVSNVTRVIEGYIEPQGGGVNSRVRIMVIMSSHLEEPQPLFEEEFTVQSTSYDQEWIAFTLSGSINLFRRVPERRFLKNWCPHAYKGPECLAESTITFCDKSLAACQVRENALRFGGEPAIPMGGLYNARD